MNPVPVTSEVFSINLIRRQLTLPPRKIVLYVALAYLGFQAVWTVGLLGTAAHSFVKRFELQHALEKHGLDLSSLKALRSEVETLSHEAEDHAGEFTSILALEKKRFPIGGKLAALTETLPSRTWITQLSADQDQRLFKIQAVYAVDPAKPFELPAKKWMEALKADPRFGSGLKRMDLESSSRVGSQDKISLYTFDLVAEWKSP